MSHRRISSLRRQSRLRRSSNDGPGVLQEDSNAFDASNDPLWFKRVEEHNSVLRPSLQFSKDEETQTDLESASCVGMPSPQDDWWDHLNKLNQPVNQTPEIRRTISSNVNTKAATENTTLHEESPDSLPEKDSRKRKTRIFLGSQMRQSVGSNAFLNVLNDSVISDPVPKNTTLHEESPDSLTEKDSRKRKTRMFLGSQKRQSVGSNAFLNVLNDSVISDPVPSKESKLITKKSYFSEEDSFTRTAYQWHSRKHQYDEETGSFLSLTPRKSRSAFLNKIKSSQSQSATNVFDILLENSSSNSEASIPTKNNALSQNAGPTNSRKSRSKVYEQRFSSNQKYRTNSSFSKTADEDNEVSHNKSASDLRKSLEDVDDRYSSEVKKNSLLTYTRNLDKEEESQDSLPEKDSRKRKTRLFLGSQKRQSVGSNAFLNVLNDSVISDPVPSKKSKLLKKKSYFSGEDSYTRTANQLRSRKYQHDEETGKFSSLTSPKSRSALLNKIQSSQSQLATNVFDNLLDNASSNSEASIPTKDIALSQNAGPTNSQKRKLKVDERRFSSNHKYRTISSFSNTADEDNEVLHNKFASNLRKSSEDVDDYYSSEVKKNSLLTYTRNVGKEEESPDSLPEKDSRKKKTRLFLGSQKRQSVGSNALLNVLNDSVISDLGPGEKRKLLPTIRNYEILKPNDIDIQKLKGSISKVVSAENNTSRISKSSPTLMQGFSASQRNSSISAKDAQTSLIEHQLRQIHGEEYSGIASVSRVLLHEDEDNKVSHYKSDSDLRKSLEDVDYSDSEVSENPLLIYTRNVDEEVEDVDYESEYEDTSPQKDLQRQNSPRAKEDARIRKQKMIDDYFKRRDEKNTDAQSQRISITDAVKNKNLMAHIQKQVEAIVAPIKKKLFEKVKNVQPPRKKLASTKVTSKNNRTKDSKSVSSCYLVNDVVYKPPKLPRPKHWATDLLYKFIWNNIEPKYGSKTRVRSEKFVLRLTEVYNRVMKLKLYKNYVDDLESLMKEMARMGLIVTPKDFNDFCIEFMPYSFREKTTPILLPGNKMSIPYDPVKFYTPILTEDST